MLDLLPTTTSKPIKPKLLKKRKVSLTEAFRDILATQPKNLRVPILSRTTVEKKLEESRLNLKAQRIFTLEKKKDTKAIQNHVTEVNVVLEKELRKLTTRGVVKLFNAVRQAQHVQEKEKPKSIVPRPEEQLEVTSAARTIFLDMLRKRPGSQTTSRLFTENETSTVLEPSIQQNWDTLASDSMLDAKLDDWDMIEEEKENEMDLDFF
ncbi:hypothetical protein HMI54_010162 [Coelomomyces lativittatus]|nr:hypothetical protein HMI54_010162 [Coelomomyces lativittatus]KAJ1501783.1 hypothetical protein HMI55_003215 [Coelomomyces lativittatus]KAJ1506808.1 hypothetical protein HMI56_000426 [Coelomomyces lativittatus]